MGERKKTAMKLMVPKLDDMRESKFHIKHELN
jgi:hypothetical protein